jgi:ketosteroid isomerase-like protein
VSELTDRVREIVDAFNRGEDLVALGVIDEDFEYVSPPDAMEPGTRRGWSGWNEALRGIFESFDEIRLETEEVRELGPDRLLLLGRLVVRGRGSGVGMDSAQSYLWTFRDGRALRMEWFWGHEAGLAAAGLDS